MTNSTTSIWRNRRFLLYATGNSINNIGNSLYLFALPLLIYSLTGSAVAMSLMMFCEAIPFLFSPFIGAVVDRVSRRTVIFSALSFQALCSLSIPLLQAAGLLEMWMLYVLGSLITLGGVTLTTAQFAVAPVMFPEQRLEARAALTTCFTITTILGPTLASLLINYMDYYSLLLLNTMTFFGPILLCIWTKIPNESQGGVASVRQVWDDTAQGVSFIFRNKLMQNLLVYSVISALASDKGVLLVLMFYMKDDLLMSDRLIGWMLILQGIGYFAGSLLPPKYKHLDRGRFLLTMRVLVCIGCALFLVPVWWFLPVALLLFSLSRMSAEVMSTVLVQENVPNDMLGRANGTMRLILSITLMISPVLLGQVLDRFGTTTAFLTIGAISLLSMAVIRLGPLYPKRQEKETSNLPV